jgi:hypothetical protein
MLRSSPALAALLAETRAVKRRMPSERARSGNWPATRCPVPALIVVDDGDGDLSGLRVLGVPDVAGNARAAPAGVVQRAERLMVVVVDVGEVAQLRAGQFVLSRSNRIWRDRAPGRAKPSASSAASSLRTRRISTVDPSRSTTGLPFTAGRDRWPSRRLLPGRSASASEDGHLAIRDCRVAPNHGCPVKDHDAVLVGDRGRERGNRFVDPDRGDHRFGGDHVPGLDRRAEGPVDV